MNIKYNFGLSFKQDPSRPTASHPLLFILFLSLFPSVNMITNLKPVITSLTDVKLTGCIVIIFIFLNSKSTEFVHLNDNCFTFYTFKFYTSFFFLSIFFFYPLFFNFKTFFFLRYIYTWPPSRFMI